MSNGIWGEKVFKEWLEDEKQWRLITDIRAWSDEDMTRHLSRDPMYLSAHLISSHTAGYREYITSDLPEQSYGLGTLDKFPGEILDYILGCLEPDWLETFGRTCKLARYFSAHQTGLVMLRKWAPMVPPIIRCVGLGRDHSINQIICEFRYAYCRSCGLRGTLLFLPTCERLCENCAYYNQAYWGIEIFRAIKAFALPATFVHKLPIMLSTKYVWLGSEPLCQKIDPTEFVAVKSVKAAALKVHGTQKNLDLEAENIIPDRFRRPTTLDMNESIRYRFFRVANLDPLNADMALLKSLPETHDPMPPWEGYYGRTTTLLPTLPHGSKKPLQTYRCAGCWSICSSPFEITSQQYEMLGVDPDARTFDKARILCGRTSLTYTVEELRRHVAGCFGAKLLMYRQSVLEKKRKEKKEDKYAFLLTRPRKPNNWVNLLGPSL
ncbi:hypothetical protein N7532_002025 [Penicillium argentinense]|uniref:F-box domain-containing protein n=1 Tax=Penicillium argentinense TaxID=1131581 RepID=A0A9W9G3K0_9EURO|nr:uncharacterized protein N7532_002025 [Penicillium argentinense]KAJ5111490.1 hypothetical protein N7532_002025 [Penicillium argentinense]